VACSTRLLMNLKAEAIRGIAVRPRASRWGEAGQYPDARGFACERKR